MTTGTNQQEPTGQTFDVEGGGQSRGVPANGELEGHRYHPLGGPGHQHWQAGYITEDGLDQRGNVFFAAIEMTRMPMVVTDPNAHDNPIAFVNKAFIDLTQYQEEDVLGRNCRLLQGPDTDPNTVAEVREAIREQRAVAVEILNYKKDGTPFWNAIFIGPVFDRAGKLLYYFSSQMDITPRRHSMQSSWQAQKMEAVGQLTAGLSHDFNNLLQIIMGNLEIAEQRVTNDAVLSKAIVHAKQATEKGARLTQQLLAFARKQRLEPKCINLNQLVVDFSELFVRTLGSKIDLRLDLKPGLPTCNLDPTHMEMALLNVLINARDAMPDGGRVTIGTATSRHQPANAPDLPPCNHVTICVMDEGFGMPPDIVRRATEPFFSTKAAGTGLGLAMVHGFVQQSHGCLEITSTEGEGTAVKMIFPLADNTSEASIVENPSTRRAVATILLVEDSDDVRQVTETYLSSLGYHVVSARSGEEALELLSKDSHVDLLLTDVIMPGGMNGLVLAQQVRKRIPDVPVVLTTGYMDELTDGARSENGMSVLPKPYRRAELEERLRTALAGAAHSVQ